MKMTMMLRVITITVTMMVMVMTTVMVTAVLVNGSKSSTEEGHMTNNTNQDNSHFSDKRYLHLFLFLFNARVYFLVWVLWIDSKAASPSIPWTSSLGVPSRPTWEGLEATGSFTILSPPFCWAQNAKDISTNPTHICTLLKTSRKNICKLLIKQKGRYILQLLTVAFLFPISFPHTIQPTLLFRAFFNAKALYQSCEIILKL